MSFGRMLRGLVRTAAVWAVASIPLSLTPFGIVLLLGGPSLPATTLARIVIGNAFGGAVLATTSLAIARRAPDRLHADTTSTLLESGAA